METAIIDIQGKPYQVDEPLCEFCERPLRLLGYYGGFPVWGTCPCAEHLDEPVFEDST